MTLCRIAGLSLQNSVTLSLNSIGMMFVFAAIRQDWKNLGDFAYLFVGVSLNTVMYISGVWSLSQFNAGLHMVMMIAMVVHTGPFVAVKKKTPPKKVNASTGPEVQELLARDRDGEENDEDDGSGGDNGVVDRPTDASKASGTQTEPGMGTMAQYNSQTEQAMGTKGKSISLTELAIGNKVNQCLG